MKAAVSIILAALFFAGCAGIVYAPKEERSFHPSPIAFKQIGNFTHSGFARPGTGIINTENEWREFWGKLYARFSPPPSFDTDLIDFSKEAAVYVATGEKPNGCYSVKIASIIMKDEKLVVTYDERIPDKGCVCLQMITTPVDIVKIEKSGKTEKLGTPPQFVGNIVPVDCQ